MPYICHSLLRGPGACISWVPSPYTGLFSVDLWPYISSRFFAINLDQSIPVPSQHRHVPPPLSPRPGRRKSGRTFLKESNRFCAGLAPLRAGCKGPSQQLALPLVPGKRQYGFIFLAFRRQSKDLGGGQSMKPFGKYSFGLNGVVVVEKQPWA